MKNKSRLYSSYFQQAKALISGVRAKKYSSDKLPSLAIDLAALILQEAQSQETSSDKKIQDELARMMDDPIGKVFTMSLTDQCFRTENWTRIADQIHFLLNRYGIPKYLSSFKKFQLSLFKSLGKCLSTACVPFIKYLLHKECSRFILPGEVRSLTKAIRKKTVQKIRVNLNHLGEAILGEEEAQRRLNTYIEDLKNPQVEYISVKISTIFSQLNLLAWNETLEILSERLKLLLNVAHENFYKRPDGMIVPKFINLDMEEYRDLHLTVELFKRVLGHPDYFQKTAGIVLQSYLPDSYLIQQDLTIWAMQRMAKGALPIKIRLVKGANLAMEKVEASLHDWPQAPYLTKVEVDANFKRMVNYACIKEHAQSAHIGIGSHNLFDIAYGLLLRAMNEVENEVCFEMLEGMANSLRRVVQDLAEDMLLYCPAAEKKEFQNAVAYLVRRLDENTSEENFLRQAFKMKANSSEWKQQSEMFLKSCDQMKNVSSSPRRLQNRFLKENMNACCGFENDPDTDWSLSQNRQWVETTISPINSMISIPGKGIKQVEGFNPSNPSKPFYTYFLAGNEEIEDVVQKAVKAQKDWQNETVEKRSDLLKKVAQQIRLNRSDLIRAMIVDTSKTVPEADVEISEAIDFLEYYRLNMEEIQFLGDLKWKPKGPVLVTPPWNFPCSIPVGGIAAALSAGNVVIFKPAPEAVFVGWTLVQLFWKAGVSKDVLQFINCEDEPYGSTLIKDSRIAVVVLTGATDTAKLFLKMNPELDLIAETGGKNAIIVSNLADRDQAVKDIVQSAFGYAGQKCSACSLVVCLTEVYEDQQFLKQLHDAAASLRIGNPWNLSTRINPLIRPAEGKLYKGLTSLEKGEQWLLEPKQDSTNPCLWSPGIKLGVQRGSFTHQEELFGPVLGIMCAKNLDEAIDIVNGTRYGLTSGLQSLDLREQNYWSERIQAGNCYINRGITGAIVQRQPFGGWKDSCYSPGAKAGGPNYVMQFMEAEQISLPKELDVPHKDVEALTDYISSKEKSLWNASIGSYAFYWKHYFSKKHDPSQVLGEDNFLRYIPRKNLTIRLNEQDRFVDVLRIVAAGLTCGTEITISSAKSFTLPLKNLLVESDQQFLSRVKKTLVKRVRFIAQPKESLRKDLIEENCYVTVSPVFANGRVELLKYMREQSLAIAYHRYGNLGDREGECRKEETCRGCYTACNSKIDLFKV